MKIRLILLALLITNLFRSQNAIQFNGINSYVAFGNNANLGLPQFALECWFKRLGGGTTTSTGTGGVTGVPLISKGRGEADGSNLDANYFLGIRQTDSTLVADFEEGSGGSTPGLNHPIAGITKLARNVWYHVAVTYNGTTWKLYLNGQLESQLTVNQPVQSLSIQHSAIGSACTSNGTAQGFFNGVIDEVRIWNFPRTQTQIVTTINTAITGTATGLVARWGFNEGTGTTVSSSAGTAITGTLINTNWSWVTQQAPFNINIAPSLPTLTAPIDSLKCAGNNINLSVNAIDANGDSIWVKFYGRQKSNAKDFSIIPLPDTQYYTSQINGATNALYKSQMNWVVAKRDSLNIKFISGLGDCVENGDNSGNDVEWKRADTAMKIVENSTITSQPFGVPYGLNVGNHDQSPGGNPAGTTTYFNQYFGATRFSGRNYWGGNYGSNSDNNYNLFTAEGIDFIVINLEYDTGADPFVLAWANGLMQTYSNRKAIVSSHWLVNLDGSFGAQGQATYNALKNNPNFFLMLCGHVAGEARRTDIFNGKIVHSVLSDYQGRTNGGNGWIRIMKFRPSAGKINVYTYSPALNQSEADADSQFILDYDFGPNFTIIDSVKVASGQTANKNWNNLLSGKNYQWFATLSDGNTTIKTQVYELNTRAYKVRLPNDTAICNNSLNVTVLSGSCTACSSFSWMNNSSGASISINTSTQVIISVNDSVNCLTRDTMLVGISNTPTQPALISGNFNPCFGINSIYSVTPVLGAVNYSWSSPSSWAGTSSSNSISLTTGSIGGILSIVASNSCGISPSRTTALNPNFIPSIPSAIFGYSTFCVFNGNSSYSISPVIGANSYSWTIPQSWSATSISNILNASPTATGGLLQVTASNSCGTSAVQSMSITVNALPIVSISAATSTLCSGNNYILTGVGANTYTWSTSTISPTLLVTPTTNITYSVIASDLNGCTNSAIKSVTVFPLPTLAISGPSSTCSGTMINLAGTGANTYTWNTSANSASISVSPISNTTYTLSGTNLNGCSNISYKNVTVYSLPLLTITGAAVICEGDVINLVAGGASTYTWSNLSNLTSINVSPSLTTTYTLIGKDQNACLNSLLKTVTVNPLPAVQINGNSDLCFGSSLTLMASGALTYTWNNSSNSNSIIVSPLSTALYLVNGTDATGCNNFSVKTVSVKPLPLVMINSNANSICLGQSLTLIASGASSYYWNNGNAQSSITISPSLTTNYSVIGVDVNGCQNQSSLNIKVNVLPIIQIIQTPTLICVGESATLTASGAFSYTWNTNQNNLSIVVSPSTNTSYTLVGKDLNSCLNSSNVEQKVNACLRVEIENLEANIIKIYPNPNVGIFNLEVTRGLNVSLKIFSVLGEIIFSTELKQGINTIEVNPIKGVYFYRISDFYSEIQSGKLIFQ